MITKLFINSCILTTFISITYIFILNKNISLNTWLLPRILIGVWGGLLGILLILFSVPIIFNVIIDFRYLPILLSALFGEILSPIIASIIIGIFRVLYFGVTKASVVALIAAFLLGTGFSILCSIKASRKVKWIQSTVYSIIVTSISIIILINDSTILFKILMSYITAIILVSYLVFKYTEYLSESVKIYRKVNVESTLDFLTGLNNVMQFKMDFNKSAK